MAVYADREAFIPYRKADVVQLCLDDGRLNPEDGKKFQEFCEIVGAYYHFDFHKDLESLKNNFTAFDPDSDTKTRVIPNADEKKQMQENLVGEFGKILEKANYSRLSDEEWQKALEKESLITLRMLVDTNDYESWAMYHRGSGQTTVELKKLFGLKKVPFTMDTYDRVVLLIKFKDKDYFLKKYNGNQKKVDALNFEPGKMYLYMYKNIPQADLEVLFPNVEIRMNMKDLVMFFVPAGGAGVATLIKIIPNLLIIIGILGMLMGIPQCERLKMRGADTKKAMTDAEKTQDNIRKQNEIIAALSGVAVLAGFVIKQFVAYKNKRINFLKQVSDMLFFRQLVCNAGVFSALIDAAEDEQCKQIFLAYYHLLVGGSMTQEQLDDTIEQWLEKKFNTKIDFDVEVAIDQLSKLKGKIAEDAAEEVPVLTKDSNGLCHILPIDDAKTAIDYVWDNIFSYNEA